MLLTTLAPAFFLSRGRITRSEWLTRIIIAALVCAAFGSLAGSWFGEMGAAVFAIVFLWSAVALSTQRLHDIGRRGWSLLTAIVPVFGPIWVLIHVLRRGVDHENRFGPDPATRSDYLKVNIGE
ncbi:DUF805 domain-containing protein [Paraburkholderia caffeinilytica]|uniref:DUF805 domain-containing protein n=1 Tax=Paraburkholderia caffeinilytica TaxID=1761016 RepID=A0ABQ1MML8_9BURK|nr:DUF805 domain-containing protein [Paraburkholderia caffeinilytica]GGC41100.1 hypothetical protein GCM10011400_29850 [Paraburkholderia caffeinilytica]CAB3787667.1 hypothetical protein LMG28690_02491 [Paraburkholderia caffeinilytica]